jgi:hypothetical protein
LEILKEQVLKTPKNDTIGLCHIVKVCDGVGISETFKQFVCEVVMYLVSELVSLRVVAVLIDDYGDDDTFIDIELDTDLGKFVVEFDLDIGSGFRVFVNKLSNMSIAFKYTDIFHGDVIWDSCTVGAVISKCIKESQPELQRSLTKKSANTYPIATLDFASLYPSIMMAHAHDLRYTAVLHSQQTDQVPPEHVARTNTSPDGVHIMEELLAARCQAKADMKASADPFHRRADSATPEGFSDTDKYLWDFIEKMESPSGTSRPSERGLEETPSGDF